jgi:hypothetical protein
VLKGQNTHPKLFNRLIDFTVLALTFYLSCLLLSVEIDSGLWLQILAYSSIVLIFVRLCKRVIVSHWKSLSALNRQILGNAAGILVGTCVMLVLEKFLAGSGEIIVALIFSSVMAFFVLGTLSPLVNKKSTSV